MIKNSVTFRINLPSVIQDSNLSDGLSGGRFLCMGSRCLLFVMILTGLAACRPSGPVNGDHKLFRSVDPLASGIIFQNTVENTDALNIFKYRNFYNGGGVAIGDLNGDGYQDIYFTANMGSNKLFLNKGDWTFQDITEQAGVGLADKWSTGVVMVDVNGDSLLDLYVCNAGYLEGRDPMNVLFINNGDGSFSDRSEVWGLNDNGYTTHAAFLDYDRDGDLDVYLLNNSFIPVNTLNYSNKRELDAEDWPVQEFLKGGGDRFLRNEGGKFVDVSDEAGIYQSLIGFGLGVTVGDINEDGYDDLYISNDFFEKDYCYINQGDGSFSEEGETYFEHISHSSMGADLRDINNDGRADLFVTDMLPRDDYRLKTNASFDDINLRRLKVEQGFYHQYMHNTLQLNSGGKFKDIAFHAGVARSDWSWGALLFDADNDSYTDIYVCNGIYHDVIDLDFMDFFANDIMQQMVLSGEKEDMHKIIDEMPSQPLANLAFRNMGDLRFEDHSAAWGLEEETFSNGCAYGDLDNDGDLDLVVNNVNQPSLVYRNEGSNRSLTVKLVGRSPNTKAIGAKVRLFHPDGVLFHQINPSRGFQSSVAYEIIFGLGQGIEVDSLQVTWPDGSRTMVIPGEETRKITLEQDEAGRPQVPAYTEQRFPEFELVAGLFEPHREDDYVDYYYERGIYRMLSREGPAGSVADVNGDGLDDVFIGGATDQAGSIYLQQNGVFKLSDQPALQQHKVFEDVAAAFFDADNDGDADLLVGSGGNHQPPNSPEFEDRLYLNDGQGQFEQDPAFNPRIGMNTSVVLPFDYDADGDLDLFIGSRSAPQHYGYPPVHFLFENDGQGGFSEVSEALIGHFSGVHMVTAAVHADLMGDSRKELVLVGDWDHPRVFTFDGSRFQEEETSLASHFGWYYAVQAADLDGDGDQDLVLGNHGSNSYLQADEDRPISLWMADFDGNAYVDRVLTTRKDGRDVPVMQKKDLADQVVSIKKQSIRHSEYARRTVQELMPEGSMSEARERRCNDMRSAVAWNLGDGRFDLEELSVEAQWSSIKAILPTDLDGDGDTDLLTGGNDFHMIPQFSRLDASFGGCLVNGGKGEFSFLPEAVSGLWVEGEIREILEIDLAGSRAFLFLINDAEPVLAKWRK